MLFEDVAFSEPELGDRSWGARDTLLLLKEKSRPEEREGDEEEDGVLLHFMFLKKAMEEILVSILCVRECVSSGVWM